MFNSFCYICFSRTHRFKDCIYAVPNLFLPNIDQNLFARFLELMVIEEKLFLMFTYPRIFTSITIKSVKVMQKQKLSFANLTPFLDSDLIVADRAYVYNSYFLFLKTRIAFRIQRLNIVSSLGNQIRLNLSSDELFLLLTFKTKALKCVDVNFDPKVTFRQIFEAAPAVEEVDIYLTNIEVDKTWMDVLEHSKYLKTVSFAIPDLIFNVENLAALIKKKENHVKINLYIIASQCIGVFDEEQSFNVIKNRFSPYFVPAQLATWRTALTVSFINDNEPSGVYNSQIFEWKDL